MYNYFKACRIPGPLFSSLADPGHTLGPRCTDRTRREIEQRSAAEFGAITDRMQRASYRAALFSALFHPSVQLLMAFALGAIILYSGGPGLVRGISVGSVQAFFGFIMMMLISVCTLGR